MLFVAELSQSFKIGAPFLFDHSFCTAQPSIRLHNGVRKQEGKSCVGRIASLQGLNQTGVAVCCDAVAPPHAASYQKLYATPTTKERPSRIGLSNPTLWS
jgi:hypothetical protein